MERNEFYLYKLNKFSCVKTGQSVLIEIINQIFWGYSQDVGQWKLTIKIHIIFGKRMAGVIQCW